MRVILFRSLVVIAILCGSLVNLTARLGEGMPQLEERYGPPVGYVSKQKKFIFQKNGFEIQVVLYQFQADVLIYRKLDKSGKSHVEIMGQERDAMMQLNAEGQSWEQVKENDNYILWRSSAGLFTTWHKKHNALIIETSGSYNRRNQISTSTGGMPKKSADKPASTSKANLTTSGKISQEKAKQMISEFARSFQQFPKAYWYAANAMLNKTNGTTFYDDPETFQKDYHLEDLNLKIYTKSLVASFKLVDPTEDEQFYKFEFRKEGDKPWEPLTGFNIHAKKSTDSSNRKGIDLYKAGFASPSLKPFIAMEVADMQAKRGKFAPLPKANIEAPRYQTLDGESRSGSGFHFEAMGRRYIACSLHQFNNRIPKHMLWNVDLHKEGAGEKPIKVVNQAYKRSDVQILSYEDKNLDQVKPLKLGNKEPLSWGHPVYLYGHEKPVLAHVFTYRDVKAKVIPSEPFMAAARSGSPVVCANTGNVIGVLLSADDPSAASWVGFQRLNLPDILFQEADPRSLPLAKSPQAHGASIFGLPFKHLDRKDLQVIESYWMPLSLLHFEIGMSPKEAFRIRPSFLGLDDEASMTSVEALIAMDSLPESLAMNDADVELKNGKLTKISLYSVDSAMSKNMSAEKVEFLTGFLVRALGEPSSFYSKIYAEFFGLAPRVIYIEWITEREKIELSLQQLSRNRCSVKLKVIGKEAEKELSGRKFELIKHDQKDYPRMMKNAYANFTKNGSKPNPALKLLK